MKSWKNRPVITNTDHPRVVATALRESIPWYNRNEPEEADEWQKTATDAYESVENDFWLMDSGLSSAVPDRESIVYMTPDQLELALVIHGIRHISDTDEVAKVDELLAGIDGLKADSHT